MRILFVATSDIHLNAFHKPYIKWLSDNNVVVDIAIENRGDYVFKEVNKAYYLQFPRSLLKKEILSSYKALKTIIDSGSYDLIHCHTPIPSMITRMAARDARKKGAKVLYTAHGFHFHKGAPIKQWMLYYPAEYVLSYFTDGIIAINKEDASFIHQKMLHQDSFYLKSGVGVNPSAFKAFNDSEINYQRSVLGFTSDSFILLYVAEFIPRKNHKFLLYAIKELVKTIPTIKVLLAGRGILLDEMKALADTLQIERNIEFLGFRSDVPNLTAIADVGISCSKHEGLATSLIEEMFCKTPVVASFVRGHKEIITHGETGFMYEDDNQKQFVDYIVLLYKDKDLRKEMGESSYKKAQEFHVSKSLASMEEIYKKYLNIV